MFIVLNLGDYNQAAPAVLARDTKFVATLGDISSSVLMLPESTGSLRGLEKRGKIAVASGAIADIWKGVWGTTPVAFKAFRFYPTQELLEAKKVIWRLAPIWKRLVHENVLPFYGVDTSTFQLALVYEWGQNGNIMEYLEFNPEASRPKLVFFFSSISITNHSLISNSSCYKSPKGCNISTPSTSCMGT